jgi:hypothetical protein
MRSANQQEKKYTPGDHRPRFVPANPHANHPHHSRAVVPDNSHLPQKTGAPHLARFSRDVGFREPKPFRPIGSKTP